MKVTARNIIIDHAFVCNVYICITEISSVFDEQNILVNIQQLFLNGIHTMGLRKSNLCQNIYCMTGFTSYNLFEVHVHRDKQKILL